VVAQETAGVPEVVCNGETGILTPSADVASFAAAIKRLLTSPETRMAMAAAARRFALSERSLDQAAVHLDRIVKNVAGSR
jgi:glycosyltransferase involved in cell wall biosynthesis